MFPVKVLFSRSFLVCLDRALITIMNGNSQNVLGIRENSFMIFIRLVDIFCMPDRYCPKCHASYTDPRKSEAVRPFARKSICLIAPKKAINQSITTPSGPPGSFRRR